jgi:hypothetical protein
MPTIRFPLSYIETFKTQILPETLGEGLRYYKMIVGKKYLLPHYFWTYFE